MPIETKVWLSLAGVGRGVDFVEEGPVCRFGPEVVVVRTRDVGHSIYPESAIRPLFQVANKIEHLVI